MLKIEEKWVSFNRRRWRRTETCSRLRKTTVLRIMERRSSSTNFTTQDSALLVVETRQDLLRLRARLHRLSLGRDNRAYQFRLPDIPSQDNERLTLLLNGYIADCGCSLGSLFLTLTAMGSLMYYFFAGGTIEAASWREILLLLSVTAAGAIAGKVLGLAYARLKMLRLVHQALGLISVRHVTAQPHQSPSTEESSWEESAVKPRNG